MPGATWDRTARRWTVALVTVGVLAIVAVIMLGGRSSDDLGDRAIPANQRGLFTEESSYDDLDGLVRDSDVTVEVQVISVSQGRSVGLPEHGPEDAWTFNDVELRVVDVLAGDTVSRGDNIVLEVEAQGLGFDVVWWRSGDRVIAGLHKKTDPGVDRWRPQNSQSVFLLHPDAHGVVSVVPALAEGRLAERWGHEDPDALRAAVREAARRQGR